MGGKESIPIEVTHRLDAGEHPLRVWREHRGMTLAELAQAADMDASYVSQIEAGKRRGSAKVLSAIAAVLDVAVKRVTPPRSGRGRSPARPGKQEGMRVSVSAAGSDQAAAGTETTNGQHRIFVQIASYRDTECQWTVKDLFEKAEHPERVFVGICWQFDPDMDDGCFLVETRPEQQRIVKFHVKDSRGVCWARHEVQKLWRGEEYTLQIDSHMRFVQNWDSRMIAMLEK